MYKKKAKLILAVLFLLCLCGCGKHLDKTTTFYSLVTSPDKNYIRLEADGDYLYSLHQSGKYEIKNGVITLHDSTGGTFTAYLDGEYIFYMPYDGNDSKIPDSNVFEVSVYDGMRSTFSFHEDGTVNQDIVDGLFDFHLVGKYERQGNIITCSYVSSDGTTTNVFGVKNGLLYSAFSSDESRFNEDDIAAMEVIDNNGSEDDVNVVAVIIILVIFVLMLGIVVFVIFKTRSGKQVSENQEK